ncbi:MAG: hypothetical protein HY300_12265 [Verrucomicrobia bacterium]|nr:hypothetical protein [Verrucomicrobiota bacterium]
MPIPLLATTPEDTEFLRRFEVCQIPFAEWKHRAHLKTAYLYLSRFPLGEATAKMRDGLKALNAVHGTPDSLDRGYHETMTVAWIRLVHFTLCEYGVVGTAEQFIDEHPELQNRFALRLFYSRDRLLSWEAKAAFIEPDLTSLPRSTKGR